MKRIALFVLIAMVHSTPSWACLNAIESRREMVQRLHLVEFHLANAQNWQAWWFMVEAGNFHDSGKMVHHAEDLEAVLWMRFADRWSYALDHFAQRTTPTARAWLAEAAARKGDRETARRLLRELVARDLMPDAFAWATLATVTTGAERERAIATCQQRAPVKRYICPSSKVT
jgi:hypothetical protein